MRGGWSERVRVSWSESMSMSKSESESESMNVIHTYIIHTYLTTYLPTYLLYLTYIHLINWISQSHCCTIQYMCGGVGVGVL